MAQTHYTVHLRPSNRHRVYCTVAGVIGKVTTGRTTWMGSVRNHFVDTSSIYSLHPHLTFFQTSTGYYYPLYSPLFSCRALRFIVSIAPTAGGASYRRSATVISRIRQLPKLKPEVKQRASLPRISCQYVGIFCSRLSSSRHSAHTGAAAYPESGRPLLVRAHIGGRRRRTLRDTNIYAGPAPYNWS